MKLRRIWNNLPRAAKWAISAGAFIALYFLVIEPALDATARFNNRSDALSAALDRRRAADRSALALAASRFGDPLLPGGPERSAELNNRIEQILRDRSVSGLTIRARAPVPLGRAVFAGLIPDGRQAERLILDVDFEADPAVAAAILADLEQAPEVAAVSRVILRRQERDGRRTVQVGLSPEAWVLSPKGGVR